jgi:hypothetical protein
MSFAKDQYNVFLKSCSPAKFYLVISLASIVVILIQNLFESYKYCLGPYSCSLDFSNIFVFLAKIIYVLIFAIILDSLCKNNHKKLAWLLVLFPYILMFVLMLLYILK